MLQNCKNWKDWVEAKKAVARVTLLPDTSIGQGLIYQRIVQLRTNHMNGSELVRGIGSIRLDQTTVGQHRLTGDVRVGL